MNYKHLTELSQPMLRHRLKVDLKRLRRSEEVLNNCSTPGEYRTKKRKWFNQEMKINRAMARASSKLLAKKFKSPDDMERAKIIHDYWSYRIIEMSNLQSPSFSNKLRVWLTVKLSDNTVSEKFNISVFDCPAKGTCFAAGLKTIINGFLFIGNKNDTLQI